MAEHEKTTRNQGADVEQKHRTMQQDSQPLFERFHNWDQGLLPLTETPFYPQMDEHAAFLATAPPGQQLHNFVIQLQRTYGNRYIQHLIRSIGDQDESTENSSNDIHEQEAEGYSSVVTRPLNSIVQRREQEEKLQTDANAIQPHSLHHLTGSESGERAIQRFAFVNGKQVTKSEKGLTSEMKNMVSDDVIRDYTSLGEFKNHANKKTDYLGNLEKDGTWLRFYKSGTNVLGEDHEQTPLDQVTNAVGTKSFIHERFSTDDLKPGSYTKAAYEAESKPKQKKFGIEKEENLKKYAAESLFPKIGFALTVALPYFESEEEMAKLAKGTYVGKPIQRYLKIAWAYSKDNLLAFKMKEKLGEKMKALAQVHQSVEGKIDKFITSLPVEGYMGDMLKDKENAKLLPDLKKFAEAFTEAMVEMAATEKSSRLTKEERKKLSSAKQTTETEKEKLFGDWRNYIFEDNVKKAVKAGVRYVGMGYYHLMYLEKVGLPSNAYPFYMQDGGKQMEAFKKHTEELKKNAKKF